VNLVDSAQTPVIAVVRGRYNAYFGDLAFQHPKIQRRMPISHITSSDQGERTVHFEDGTFESGVDHLIFGTGFSWTLPFLPQVATRNNRVPDLYQHVFYRHDPTLTFVGAVSLYYAIAWFLSVNGLTNFSQVGAGLTFKVFEWQAVAAARVLAGRATLPSVAEQEKWETDRIAEKTDGPAFTVLNPEFEAYFEGLRLLAGEPRDGTPGRRLPRFEQKWLDHFNDGHERRKKMWRKANEAARL
jgi:hypothetical protein